jgi:hypothetical protein
MAGGCSHHDQTTYQIKIREKIRESWSKWFGDATILYDLQEDGNPVTIITWESLDQAGLHGILNRVLDLNLTLLSVWRIEKSSDAGGVR